MRVLFGQKSLTWEDSWFNTAYDAAIAYADKDIAERISWDKSDMYAEMNAKFPCMD